MPNNCGDFPVFCGSHYKSHKRNYSKHMLVKQSFVGHSWVEEHKEDIAKENKCSLCKSDLIMKEGLAFNVYK